MQITAASAASKGIFRETWKPGQIFAWVVLDNLKNWTKVLFICYPCDHGQDNVLGLFESRIIPSIFADVQLTLWGGATRTLNVPRR